MPNFRTSLLLTVLVGALLFSLLSKPTYYSEAPLQELPSEEFFPTARPTTPVEEHHVLVSPPTNPPTEAPTSPPTPAPTRPPTPAPTRPPTPATSRPPTPATSRPPTPATSRPPNPANSWPPSPATSRPPVRAPTNDIEGLDPLEVPKSKSGTCRHDVLNIVEETDKAQLNLQQRTWIATTMLAYTSTRSEGQPLINVLVWGLGYDSPLWYAAHCNEIKQGGKLAYLESNQEWIDSVVSANPQFTAYYFPTTNYKTTLATAEEFINNPYDTLELPAAVESTCWDVVLIDAPPGYSKFPGRQEATWWTMQMARKCHEAGHPRDITIFLHDVNRKVETLIFNNLLLSVGEDLGLAVGEFGDLMAVRVKRPSA